ncbi:exodeoxyribonuclease V subunit alpha [Marinobacter sp. F4216]|uniref:exodeoxyribonuclease V subunit alpha n=1 Tax=Marinobacter sp. F4216 TaxID=2874281 RepID=UPI001CBD73DA|nr:exodeoxyribonuclease V subunit alpha [Marinobacter sp. F4216]MBZ2169556.1 exodeoxyribonuclease V subunit alpha [Marinobacter sp. F4216]
MSPKRPSDLQFALDLDTDSPDTSAPEQSEPQTLLGDSEAMMGLLAQWRGNDWLQPLDVEFARFLRQSSTEQGEPLDPIVILLAALVSHQVGRGHVCIDLHALLSAPRSTLPLPPEDGHRTDGAEACLMPEDILSELSVETCMAALNGSSTVSNGSLTTPLILSGTKLYLRRLWRCEQQIAEGINARLSAPTELTDVNSEPARMLATTLSRLFRQNPDGGVNYQKLACALAARNRFAVITGGPGTGKTTTVVKLLAALQAIAGARVNNGQACRVFRIRLAAPTGKAAARLNESISKAVEELPWDELSGSLQKDDIPTRVTTLHRLLGSRPDSRRFRHDRENPLIADILVIDEASMVDVDMMASVFDALPEHAQLILLGDKDQLASVDAGAVLGELCQRAFEGHYSAETAQWLREVTGYELPEDLQQGDGRGLDQAVAMLRRSYRFEENSGIKALADAVNNSALSDDLLHKCRDKSFNDLAWLGPDTPVKLPGDLQQLIANHAVTGSPECFQNAGKDRQVRGTEVRPPVGYGHYLQLMNDHNLNARNPRSDWEQLARQVLEAFADFQILCAVRQGPWGVDGLNELVVEHFSGKGLIRTGEGPWYNGRPVMVTGNDYNLGLMNGDVGITFRVPWGQDAKPMPMVAFPASDGSGEIRWISSSRLQQFETVFAMTVHKSQGSEFTHTCLVLPDRLSPVMTRELVYTGITRAKHWFSLITGDPRVLRDSVQQRVVRASGLAGLLGQD